MITLSAFADEISPNLDEAVAVLKDCGIGAIDLRGVDGTNVMKFTDAQVSQIKKTLRREKISVACIASPDRKSPGGRCSRAPTGANEEGDRLGSRAGCAIC